MARGTSALRLSYGNVLYALYNFKTDRVSFFEYDHAGRCMASTEKSFTHTTAYAVTAVGAEVSAYAYQYDALNRLSNLTCVVAGGEWDTVYTYDGDSRPLTTMLDNGKVLTNTYDAIGRLTKRRIGLTTNYDTTLTYLAGASGSQTSLPASYQNGSDAAYTYTYDANGNIQTITQGTTVTTYLYDEANQLTREDNGFTNETVVYEYDAWGNLSRKLKYPLTSGTVDPPSTPPPTPTPTPTPTATPTPNVTATPPTSTYQIALRNGIVNGQYVITNAAGTYALSNVATANGISAQAVTPTNGAIVNPSGNIVWILTKSSNLITLRNSATGQYAVISGNSADALVLSASSGDPYTISSPGGLVQMSYGLRTTATGTRSLAWNSDGFYASIDTTQIKLYKLVESGSGEVVMSASTSTPYAEQEEVGDTSESGSQSDDAIPSRDGDPVYPETVYEYVYGNSAWQDQLTQIKTYSVSAAGVQTLINTQTMAYDTMGNPTAYLGKTLSWEGKQLTGVSATGQSVSYAYDENGLRTQKTVNGTTTNYYYNGSVLIGMVTGSGSSAIVQRFSYDSSGSVVSVDYSADNSTTFTTYYYLRNGQGDIVKLIDGCGMSVVQYTYDTWGKQASCTGTLASTVGANQPFRYRGYVYDTETGWYYLQSRYYNPTTCRFISSDVMLSTGQGVLGCNAYSYCRNNPICRFDYSGHEDEIVYIFYTSYSQDESSNGEGDFLCQAQYYKETCEANGAIVYMIETNTVDDFIAEWNAMCGDIDTVYIFSHGDGRSLIFQDGKGISSTGMNKAGERIAAICDLNKVSISSLWLMSCNSGHLDLFYETDVNVAAAFCRLGTIDSVYAFDGNMSFGRSGLCCSKSTDFKARLSTNQGGFRSVYSNFGLDMTVGRPVGWVRYYLIKE